MGERLTNTELDIQRLLMGAVNLNLFINYLSSVTKEL
jgi:hypothetical protein